MDGSRCRLGTDREAIQLRQNSMNTQSYTIQTVVNESRQKRIKRLLRPFVRRTMSPGVVRELRFRYWWLSSYFPRLFTSGFAIRTPEVRGFGPTQLSSALVKQLESVNVFAPTKT